MQISGRLTDDDMDMLEWWIGKESKRFTLLYAITLDGCSSTSFHQKCDNQGPTVTVLYNPQGSVYGGYASISWKSEGGDQNTSDSFLFQLYYSGKPKSNKFMVKKEKQSRSLYFSPAYGPDFGNADDLKTFTGSISKADGYFPLNGCIKIGADYENLGVKAEEINNGTMNVTEMEVYKVTDGTRERLQPKDKVSAWRATKHWDTTFLNELKEDIKSFRPPEDMDVNEARILMIGPVGAGKSSVCNTITSVFRERISRKACSGSAEQSLTTSYTPYRVKGASGDYLKFRLCDTRGLEESSGLGEVECNYLLDGSIPDYYQFSTAPVSSKTAGFKSEPSVGDQIHAVIFVLDATTLDVISLKLVEKMKGFQVLMNHKGIPQLIVLTKVDKLCEDVKKDVSYTLKSPQVEQHVDKAAQFLGLPRGNVLPVKNYENETELDDNINILALLALREILYSAEDFLENLAERNNDQRKDIEPVEN